MKKTYQKPELFYENFALLESIASCEYPGNYANDSSCGYELPGLVDPDLGQVTIFNIAPGVSSCNADPGYMGGLLCTHVPLDSTTLFQS